MTVTYNTRIILSIYIRSLNETIRKRYVLFNILDRWKEHYYNPDNKLGYVKKFQKQLLQI